MLVLNNALVMKSTEVQILGARAFAVWRAVCVKNNAFDNHDFLLQRQFFFRATILTATILFAATIAFYSDDYFEQPQFSFSYSDYFFMADDSYPPSICTHLQRRILFTATILFYSDNFRNYAFS